MERFHRTLQRETLDNVDVGPTLETAQAAIDAFRSGYNGDRQHQSLGTAPAKRFTTRWMNGFHCAYPPRWQSHRRPRRSAATLPPDKPAPPLRII